MGSIGNISQFENERKKTNEGKLQSRRSWKRPLCVYYYTCIYIDFIYFSYVYIYVGEWLMVARKIQRYPHAPSPISYSTSFLSQRGIAFPITDLELSMPPVDRDILQALLLQPHPFSHSYSRIIWLTHTLTPKKNKNVRPHLPEVARTFALQVTGYCFWQKRIKEKLRRK